MVFNVDKWESGQNIQGIGVLKTGQQLVFTLVLHLYLERVQAQFKFQRQSSNFTENQVKKKRTYKVRIFGCLDLVPLNVSKLN